MISIAIGLVVGFFSIIAILIAIAVVLRLIGLILYPIIVVLGSFLLGGK